MSIYAHLDGLGVIIEQCIADSILAWRREFRPGRKVVDTLAENLESVKTEIRLRPGGVVLIHVQILAKRWPEHTQEVFRAVRVRGGRFMVTASSISER